jgi:hypothetical protein
MATTPQNALPKQYASWSDVKAAYRFLNNPKIAPEQIQATHRDVVSERCATYDRILVVQDGTELDFTKQQAKQGLGFTGGGIGHGLLQHSALAVGLDGELLGVLHQCWWCRQRTTPGETRRQRQARETEASLWANTIEAIGALNDDTRLTHVMDRGSDSFETIDAARRVGVDFVLRAKHDRKLESTSSTLWALMSAQRVCGHREIAVNRQPRRGSRPAVPARTACLAIRYAPIMVPPPTNDPRFKDSAPVGLWAVYALEESPSADVDAVEWMLLCTEPVKSAEDANARIEAYTHRWIIEEWHKVEKTGCRLEASQLRDADAIERLAALTAVVAVRMLQLRRMARASGASEPLVTCAKARDDEGARRLQATVPQEWLAVVAHLAKCPTAELTPALYWLTIAKQGGFIARRSDGWPGWQTLWCGWSRIHDMVRGLQLARIIFDEKSYG